MQLGYDQNGTCTMLWLSGLDSPTLEDPDEWDAPEFDTDGSYELWVMSLNSCIQHSNKDDEWRHQQHGDDIQDTNYGRPYLVKELGLVCAISSSQQSNAEKYLEQFGFSKSGPYISQKYKDSSQTTLWWMHAPAMVERCEEEMRRITE